MTGKPRGVRSTPSTEADVERALSHDRPSMDDFAALVSPAADKYLNEMAAKSYRITRRRFGNTMQLYIPLYLANICQNHCVYCGFNCTNKIHRAILTPDEIHAECQAIKKDPFEHILLVTGEAPRSSSVQYMADSMEIVKQYFQQISLEVQPLETDEYRMLMDHGLHSVYVYQETYNRERYPVYHLRGRKADYRYRLETPDRLCEAGVYKVGVGNLIGLEDWRTEAFFTALHVRYLENRYWRQKYSIAFPRLRPLFRRGRVQSRTPDHRTQPAATDLRLPTAERRRRTVDLDARKRRLPRHGDAVRRDGHQRRFENHAGRLCAPDAGASNSGPSTTIARRPRCSTRPGPKGSSRSGKTGRALCRKPIFPLKTRKRKPQPETGSLRQTGLPVSGCF